MILTPDTLGYLTSGFKFPVTASIRQRSYAVAQGTHTPVLGNHGVHAQFEGVYPLHHVFVRSEQNYRSFGQQFLQSRRGLNSGHYGHRSVKVGRVLARLLARRLPDRRMLHRKQ